MEQIETRFSRKKPDLRIGIHEPKQTFARSVVGVRKARLFNPQGFLQTERATFLKVARVSLGLRNCPISQPQTLWRQVESLSAGNVLQLDDPDTAKAGE